MWRNRKRTEEISKERESEWMNENYENSCSSFRYCFFFSVARNNFGFRCLPHDRAKETECMETILLILYTRTAFRKCLVQLFHIFSLKAMQWWYVRSQVLQNCQTNTNNLCVFTVNTLSKFNRQLNRCILPQKVWLYSTTKNTIKF